MKKCVVATLKGQAVILAIEAGLIHVDKNGYQMGAFLKFWDSLEKLLEKNSEEGK